jgi:hypothetical protein
MSKYPKNHGRPWAVADVKTAKQWWTGGVRISSIAEGLGRTPYAVALKLGVPDPGRFADWEIDTPAKQEHVKRPNEVPNGSSFNDAVPETWGFHRVDAEELAYSPASGENNLECIEQGEIDMKTAKDILRVQTIVLGKELSTCNEEDILKAIALAEQSLETLESFDVESKKMTLQKKDLKKCIVDLAKLYDQL